MTITLAVGVQAMARRHAIVRHLPSIETLGAVSGNSPIVDSGNFDCHGASTGHLCSTATTALWYRRT